jgi:hypothetical protein
MLRENETTWKELTELCFIENNHVFVRLKLFVLKPLLHRTDDHDQVSQRHHIWIEEAAMIQDLQVGWSLTAKVKVEVLERLWV